jgi:hypothetical protein
MMRQPIEERREVSCIGARYGRLELVQDMAGMYVCNGSVGVVEDNLDVEGSGIDFRFVWGFKAGAVEQLGARLSADGFFFAFGRQPDQFGSHRVGSREDALRSLPLSLRCQSAVKAAHGSRGSSASGSMGRISTAATTRRPGSMQ